MTQYQEDPLALDGKTFATQAGTWRARLVNRQDPAGVDRACYFAEFRRVEEAGPARNLNLWILDGTAPCLPGNNCQAKIFDLVKQWLETESTESDLSIQYSGESVPIVALQDPRAGAMVRTAGPKKGLLSPGCDFEGRWAEAQPAAA